MIFLSREKKIRRIPYVFFSQQFFGSTGWIFWIYLRECLPILFLVCFKENSVFFPVERLLGRKKQNTFGFRPARAENSFITISYFFFFVVNIRRNTSRGVVVSDLGLRFPFCMKYLNGSLRAFELRRVPFVDRYVYHTDSTAVRCDRLYSSVGGYSRGRFNKYLFTVIPVECVRNRDRSLRFFFFYNSTSSLEKVGHNF